MPYEVEMKFPVGNLQEIEQSLESLGAKRIGCETEVDLYFQHPARSFAETDEALRVRQANSRVFLTYKGPKIDRKTKTRIEIEPELLPGPLAFQNITTLLQHLGFLPAGEVRKQRTLVSVVWKGKPVQACLDAVEGLGNYVELELSSESDDLENFRQLIESLSKHLNLHDSERKSYLEMLLSKQPARGKTSS